MLAVKQFFSKSWLLKFFNSSFIIMIPKVDGALWISHFSLIVFNNLTFKIIPDIIKKHLKLIALRTISLHQASFIKGRSTFYCISLLSKGTKVLKNKAHNGSSRIKLDISKSFDMMRWDFII